MVKQIIHTHTQRAVSVFSSDDSWCGGGSSRPHMSQPIWTAWSETRNKNYKKKSTTKNNNPGSPEIHIFVFHPSCNCPTKYVLPWTWTPTQKHKPQWTNTANPRTHFQLDLSELQPAQQHRGPRPYLQSYPAPHLQVEEKTSKGATENEMGHSLLDPSAKTYQGSASALNQPGLRDMLKWQSSQIEKKEKKT